MFHKKLAAAALCAVIALAGCGSASTSESTAASAAESTESAAESVASTSESAESTAESASEEAESTETEVTVDDAEIVDEEPTDETLADFIEIGEYKGFGIVADTAAEGDTVNIDYVGYLDGEAFDGGSDAGYDLILGSDTFIDGFEDQLIGAQAGDEVTVEVTFPDDYSSEDLAGQDATFEVTVNAVYVETPADAFEELMESSTALKYPSAYIDLWTEVETDMYETYASYYGMELDEFMETSGITDETLEEYAKAATKSQLVAKAVIAAEGITSDDDVYAEAEAAVLASTGYESMDAVLDDGITEEQFYYAVEMQIVYDLLVEYSA